MQILSVGLICLVTCQRPRFNFYMLRRGSLRGGEVINVIYDTEDAHKELYGFK